MNKIKLQFNNIFKQLKKLLKYDYYAQLFGGQKKDYYSDYKFEYELHTELALKFSKLRHTKEWEVLNEKQKLEVTKELIFSYPHKKRAEFYGWYNNHYRNELYKKEKIKRDNQVDNIISKFYISSNW